MTIISPILGGLEIGVKKVIELFTDRKRSLVVILDTVGGIVEVVERMVTVIRQHYSDVIFIIPDKAMSAGTIFAMAGDRILMNYFSCLGPIDPQIERDGKLVPALSYLNQFERLNSKALAGQLTTAEYALLNKLDLGELYQFEQARELSVELLKKWLSTYKFKNWTVTETRKVPVTPDIKKRRAEDIARTLSNNERWHSHGRGIDMRTLQSPEIGLLIEDISTIPGLPPVLDEYVDLLRDHMRRVKLNSFIHTKNFF